MMKLAIVAGLLIGASIYTCQQASAAEASITCTFGGVPAELKPIGIQKWAVFMGQELVDTYSSHPVKEGTLFVGRTESILLQPSGEALLRPIGVGMGTIGECH